MEPILLSRQAYMAVARSLADNSSPQSLDRCGSASTLFGIRIEICSALPTRFECASCEGTGEGESSTYCRGCRGAGEIEAVGTTGESLITRALTRKFEPAFPSGIVAQPKLCRGLV
jgi:hypothetical protein